MPGSTPPTSQLEWLSSTTAMIVLFWSRATRDLLRSFGWGIAALHRENAAAKLPFHRRPPHSVCRSRMRRARVLTFAFGRSPENLWQPTGGTRSLRADRKFAEDPLLVPPGSLKPAYNPEILNGIFDFATPRAAHRAALLASTAP